MEEVFDPAIEISLEDAEKINRPCTSVILLRFRFIQKIQAYCNAEYKNLILQKIREEERKLSLISILRKRKILVTGIVQRYVGKNISINLGRADAMLTENEQIKGEHLSRQSVSSFIL